MTKFTELFADKVLAPKTDTLVLTLTVVPQAWLYMPKFIMIRRTDVQPGTFTPTPTINFWVMLTTPVAPTPFVVEEFQMTKANLHRVPGYTQWGYQDKLDIYAKCEVGVRIQMLISCLIDQATARDP